MARKTKQTKTPTSSKSNTSTKRAVSKGIKKTIAKQKQIKGGKKATPSKKTSPVKKTNIKNKTKIGEKAISKKKTAPKAPSCKNLDPEDMAEYGQKFDAWLQKLRDLKLLTKGKFHLKQKIFGCQICATNDLRPI